MQTSSMNTTRRLDGSNNKQDIWHKNPMVWFIILLPLSVVIASLITMSIAVRHAPAILSDSEAASHSSTNHEPANTKGMDSRN